MHNYKLCCGSFFGNNLKDRYFFTHLKVKLFPYLPISSDFYCLIFLKQNNRYGFFSGFDNSDY